MQPASSTAPPANSVRRVVLASFIGTTIEWYDFFLYVTAATVVFPAVFFPKSDPEAGLIAAYATNAVGFFARPLGGMIFSHIGDRVGRKSVLVTTLALMGVATFLIGVLPSYAAIGIWAPILLVLLRCVQGFGVGGEWGGAVLMAVEHGGPGKRGYYASWVQAGVPFGGLIAAGIFSLFAGLLPEKDFLSWGWRIPFLLGIFLLAVGMFIRLKVYESPVFEKVKQEGSQVKLPVLEAIRRHPKNVLLAMGARFAENACFYIFAFFVVAYGMHLGLDRSLVLNGVLIGYAVQLVAIPFFGALSDRVGRRPVYLGGAASLLVFPFVFFAMIETKSTPLIWLAIVVGLVIHSAMYGPQAAFFSELFGTKVRFSGASLGYQLAAPLAGGLAPVIAAKLLQDYQASWPIATYLVIMAVITLVCVALARETHRQDIDH